MTINPTNDIDILFTDWGEVASYVASTGDVTTVSAVFESGYLPLNLALGIIETAKPAVIVRSADVDGTDHQARVIIRGKTYRVASIQVSSDDLGEGLTRLILTSV